MRSRRGLGVLAVCGLVLGLMAISASGAQATTHWMINKANINAPAELKVEANVEIEPLGAAKEKHVVLLTTSGANTVEILCGAINTVTGVVTQELITGTVNFSSCTTTINGKAESKCNPLAQPIKAGGTIHIVLHEGKVIALAEGPAGVFATLKFSEECLALPETVKITGMGWLEDCNNEFEVEKLTHLVQEAKAAAEKLGGLFFGSRPATIDGSVNVTLTGAHTGMTFSGLDK